MSFWETIIEQLGGNRFVAMTGAKNFVFSNSEKSLRFSIGRNSHGVNRVRIILTPADDYTMQFISVRGESFKIKQEVKGVYCDMLEHVFTKCTGLYTRLF